MWQEHPLCIDTQNNSLRCNQLWVAGDSPNLGLSQKPVFSSYCFICWGSPKSTICHLSERKTVKIPLKTSLARFDTCLPPLTTSLQTLISQGFVAMQLLYTCGNLIKIWQHTFLLEAKLEIHITREIICTKCIQSLFWMMFLNSSSVWICFVLSSSS